MTEPKGESRLDEVRKMSKEQLWAVIEDAETMRDHNKMKLAESQALLKRFKSLVSDMHLCHQNDNGYVYWCSFCNESSTNPHGSMCPVPEMEKLLSEYDNLIPQPKGD